MSKSVIGTIAQETISAKPHRKKRRSRKSGKLKKQDKIRRLILNYGKKNIPISFKQIAKKVGCTETYAKITVAKLVKAGKVIKTKNLFLSKKYAKHRVLCGKNLYTSPSKKSAETAEDEDAKITPKSLTSSKEEIAKGQALRNFSKEGNSQDFLRREEKFSLLKPFGFESLVEKAPNWWFKDLTKLQKALSLIKKKLKKGWKCRNKIKFTTFLLKHGIFGYRRHCGRNLSLAVAHPTLDRIEPLMASDAVAQGYEALRELHRKHGLDMSFTNMTKLLRKKYPQLSTAAQVMLKRLNIPGVQDVNKYLHFLVSMPEPYEVLKRKAS